MSRYTELNTTCADDLPRNKSIKTLYHTKTDYNADSVEWCPHENYKHLFVCGNYQLAQENTKFAPNQRIGKILLYSVSQADGLVLQYAVKTAAILDQKWSHKKINDKIVLAVAKSNSEIELYELKQKTNEGFTLEHMDSFSFPKDHDLLILSLDWSNNKCDFAEPEIVCSDSVGGVHIIKLTGEQMVLKLSILKFHEFETWIAGFYYWDTNIFFSGGDDCILYKYDQRCGSEPVSKNKSHEAGVTTLHSNSGKEYVLASGSYDEHVRIWDIRNFKSPTSELKTPGPLWRVKWDPFSQNCLLTASMLGGVHVICTNDTHASKIIDSYYEHQSMAYGADWCFMVEEDVKKYPLEGNVIFASCSFYDNFLCVNKLKCDL